MIEIIAHALVPIFFVIGLGYVAGLSRSIDNHHVGELNALVMQFALPASLFVATATTPWSKMQGEESIVLLLGVAMMVPYAIWYLVARRKGVSHSEASLRALTVALPNFAAAGLPIAQAVIGPAATIHGAIAIALGSILPSPVTLLILEMAQPADGKISTAHRVLRSMRRSLLKPIVAAPIVGTLISFAGFELDPLMASSLQLIGASAGSIALFLTGLVLSSQPFRLNRSVVEGTLVATVARPALVWGMTILFAVPAEEARIAILLAAMPSGFFGILFGINYKAASQTVGSIVIATTVTSAVTIGVVIALLFPA